MRSVLGGSGTGGEFRASSCRGKLIKAVLKGIYDGPSGIPKMLRKRRELMSRKKLSEHEFSKLLSRYNITFRELLDHD